ncbi:MAG: hypothetical protein ACRELA_23405, partial [Candidatus Rokuibacteriota bacterium]
MASRASFRQGELAGRARVPGPKMSRALPTTKAEVREMIWRAMEMRGIARFPGTKGRIPNFAGAERAALQLQG